MARDLYDRTLQRAYRLLSYKPRTVAEMRGRLNEKEWADGEVVERVIGRLLELGYLDDERYAASFAESRLSGRALGRTRLRRDLQRRNLPSEVIENALDEAYNEQGEEALIDRAIEKRLKLKGAPSTREESKKLFDYLMRRGFNYDLVMRKVRSIGLENDEPA